MSISDNFNKNLSFYLPRNYKKEVCKRLDLEYNKSSCLRIYRVKKGLTNDLEILNALVDLALEKKNKKQDLLDKLELINK